MWGQQPELIVGRYGDFKTDNTAHLFEIGNVLIESYFSPSDETNCQILEALQSTDHHVEIGLLLLTNEELIDEILALHQNGVQVRVILEDEASSSDAVIALRQAGVPLVTHDFGSIFHHKYAIIDEGFPASDPQVVSGSHNWTWSADNINDENTLIFHDQSIANIFRQEFEARWTEIYTTSNTEIETDSLLITPNPASTFVDIHNPSTQACRVELHDLNGHLIGEIKMDAVSGARMNVQHIPPGMYVLVLHWPEHQTCRKLIIGDK